MASLDVRSIIAHGGDPFETIMRVVLSLEPSEEFELVAPIDPIPLYSVLDLQGFDHETADLGDGDFKVVFRRRPQTEVG